MPGVFIFSSNISYLVVGMFPQVRIDLVDSEFGLERRDVLEAVCFWPRDGGLGVDPGVFADEFEHRCREVGVPAAKATLGKALIGNHGLTRIGFVQEPARSRSRPFQAFRALQKDRKSTRLNSSH